MLYKIIVFVPTIHEEKLRLAMANAGAGKFEKYDNCFFKTKGVGHFRPLEGSNPYIGEQGEITTVEEYKLETVVIKEKLHEVLKAMRENHPYEEIAFDVIEIKTGEYYDLVNG